MRRVDLPDALPDGSRFIHIGLPKTGTTALQGALDRARPELERLGAHNVNRGRHEMRVGQVADPVGHPGHQCGLGVQALSGQQHGAGPAVAGQ